ncbi:MAG: CRISPR system precrRNA processing endoribonuclease RAMP protein Cas6 [Chlorobi bacterium]|nr:CRISPR system precrRNA processing endoribonuclease RAMP protein Cas6 [Chlorobiota bacterium]
MKLIRLQLTYQAMSDAVLPGQLGSMLRGIFGETLYEFNQDLFSKFFEPKIPKNNPVYKLVMNNPPAPFMFYPVKKYNFVREGEKIKFNFTLFGEYRHFKLQVEEVFQFMGKKRWNNGKLSVKMLESKILPEKNGEIVYDWNNYKNIEINTQKTSLEFKTPVSIAHNKKLISDFEFERLFGFLYRRMFILDNAYGDGIIKEQHNYDFGQLNIYPEYINLQRVNIFRHSTRNQKHPMTGWKGKLTYKGNFNDILTYLIFGQYVHIGNYTVFGLGKYTIK